MQHQGGIRASDLQPLRCRPARGADLPAPALRLGGPARSRQRPSDLLQGPRLAAAVRGLQGRGRDHRSGAGRDLPPVRVAPAGTSHAGAALGGRRHRLARSGTARRRRDRARRPVPRSAAVPGVGAVRRQRDGRGLHLGGAGQGRPLRAAQPDGDRRREPVRAAGPDRVGMGPGHLPAAGRGVRLPGARRRRPRPGRHRRGVGPRPAGDGSHGGARPDGQGQGSAGDREPAGMARQAAETGDGRARPSTLSVASARSA